MPEVSLGAATAQREKSIVIECLSPLTTPDSRAYRARGRGRFMCGSDGCWRPKTGGRETPGKFIFIRTAREDVPLNQQPAGLGIDGSVLGEKIPLGPFHVDFNQIIRAREQLQNFGCG